MTIAKLVNELLTGLRDCEQCSKMVVVISEPYVDCNAAQARSSTYTKLKLLKGFAVVEKRLHLCSAAVYKYGNDWGAFRKVGLEIHTSGHTGMIRLYIFEQMSTNVQVA
jgi:hypothetical protein